MRRGFAVDGGGIASRQCLSALSRATLQKKTGTREGENIVFHEQRDANNVSYIRESST